MRSRPCLPQLRPESFFIHSDILFPNLLKRVSESRFTRPVPHVRGRLLEARERTVWGKSDGRWSWRKPFCKGACHNWVVPSALEGGLLCEAFWSRGSRKKKNKQEFIVENGFFSKGTLFNPPPLLLFLHHETSGLAESMFVYHLSSSLKMHLGGRELLGAAFHFTEGGLYSDIFLKYICFSSGSDLI